MKRLLEWKVHKNDPESMARSIIGACADCDICRYLMDDTPCLVFPELYRLYDREAEKSGPITPAELRNLVNLCNFCALCPCPNVRSDLMKAKQAFVSRDGLQPTLRLLEDVERISKLCGAYPRLSNRLFQSRLTGGALKNLAGMHPERNVPVFPEENFRTWARRRGFHKMSKSAGQKVAYFVGCTGQYLFPDVPRAVVEVLEHNGVAVYIPEQKCCGMPSFLEGDQSLTHSFMTTNVDHLAQAVEAGYDIVCSCPTCGYMLKNVLTENACHAAANQALPELQGNAGTRRQQISSSDQASSMTSPKPVFAGLFKDDGYFAHLSAAKRLLISSHTHDLGEYLLRLHAAGELNTNFGPVSGHMAYYPPCHQREQKIGEPYADLLKLLPELSLQRIDGAFYCCGIAGIMGFKRDFHEVSVQMGHRLMEKIRSINPERLLSDCLSCRLQFNQLIPHPVSHPVQILAEAYAKYGNGHARLC